MDRQLVMMHTNLVCYLHINIVVMIFKKNRKYWIADINNSNDVGALPVGDFCITCCAH